MLGNTDVQARYRVGIIIAGIKAGERKYGVRAVEKLADALGRSAASLYRHATVAERWSRAEVNALLRRRNSRGQPLSWSHWVFLASVASTKERARLLDEALTKSLSARELAGLVTQEDAEDSSPKSSRLPTLRTILAETDNVTARWRQLAAGVGQGEAQKVDEAIERTIQALKAAQLELRQRQVVQHAGDESTPAGKSSTKQGRVPWLLAGGA